MEEIRRLERELTGVFFEDLYIQEKINYLKRNLPKEDQSKVYNYYEEDEL